MSSPIILPANISSNVLLSPTNVESSLANRIFSVSASVGGTPQFKQKFVLVTGLTFANKTSNNLAINAKIVNGASSASILFGVPLPANTAFELIQNNKLILKEGDELYIWHNSTQPGALDVVMSYTLHNPMTTYDI